MANSSLPTNSGRSGRGPTKLISPGRMFHNCGSSLRWLRRKDRPKVHHARVIHSRPTGASDGFVVIAHGPNLVDRERTPAATQPGLPVDSRRTVQGAAFHLHGA